jgi:Sulfotransferase family
MILQRVYNSEAICADRTGNVDSGDGQSDRGRLMNPTAHECSKPAAAVSMAPGPLFIVASWRGGSSLLYALLNKHPQVGLTFEADLWLLRSVFRKPARYCDWAARWELRHGALSRHGINPNDLPRGVADYPTAFAAAHKAYAARKGAVIWGDKSPIYFDSLPVLARLFPQARFIVQWRDPAATANALARGAQSGGTCYQKRGVYVRGLIGYQVLKRGVDYLLSIGQPVCQVTYEELTSDTAKVMREVCRFLEIPYGDELAELRGADRSAVYNEAYHSLVRGDEIVSRPRTVILDQAVRQKINGYVKLWKRRYNEQWPPSVLTDADDVALPRLPQRVGDQLAYRAVCAFDQFQQICFAYAPLALIQSYRSRRRGVRFPANKQTGDAQG